MLKRPIVWIPAAGAVLIAAVVVLSLFQPWKLFVDERVNEALPTAQATAAPATPTTPTSAPATPTSPATPTTPTATPTPPPAEPIVLAEGAFISHEHETTGTVRILEVADGQRVLRIEGLDTSNGPDLKVWLTDAPVLEGQAGWYVFDDGAYVDLGVLKGNLGNSNYPIPADVDLADLTSLSIWCDRFSVSFGAAQLTQTA